MEPCRTGGAQSHADLEVPVMEEIQLNLELWVKLSAGRWKNITSIPKAGLVRNPSCSCQGRAPCLHEEKLHKGSTA